jgi:hypothetical protein
MARVCGLFFDYASLGRFLTPFMGNGSIKENKKATK